MWVLSNAHPLWRVLLEFGKGIGSQRFLLLPLSKNSYSFTGTGLTTAVFLPEKARTSRQVLEKIQKQTENTKKGEGLGMIEAYTAEVIQGPGAREEGRSGRLGAG